MWIVHLFLYLQAATHPHGRCGWIEVNDETGIESFVAHARWFDAIHPDWYKVAPDGDGVREQKGSGDARVVRAARAAGVLLMPMVAGVDRKLDVRHFYLDGEARAAHVAALVAVVTKHGWDGLDVDYEKLPDGDRAAFTRFVEELAAALHARGKLLSVTVRATAEDVGPYDYVAVARAADWVHVMTYDLHWLGGPELGPVAPPDWVEAVAARIESLGVAAKFSLGMPNYGITARSSCRLDECPARCLGPIADDGGARRCRTAEGDQYFDDARTLGVKRGIARRHGFGGITYWSLGGEVPGFFKE